MANVGGTDNCLPEDQRQKPKDQHTIATDSQIILLKNCHWPLATGCWLLAAGCWLLAADTGSQIILLKNCPNKNICEISSNLKNLTDGLKQTTYFTFIKKLKANS